MAPLPSSERSVRKEMSLPVGPSTPPVSLWIGLLGPPVGLSGYDTGCGRLQVPKAHSSKYASRVAPRWWPEPLRRLEVYRAPSAHDSQIWRPVFLFHLSAIF